jgi:hypothetical protein
LRRAESLTHGIEIFQDDFGKEMVEDSSCHISDAGSPE